MITTKPYYYDSFKCIADKCNDSCCIGWEIDIDPETLDKYKKEDTPLGKSIMENIEDASFVLRKDERCPFLKQNGLCELICQRGQEFLCEICREHPRYHEYYGNHHDLGLGLCCEEACRLLFSSDNSFTLIKEGDTEEKDDLISSLLSEREVILQKLCDRSLPLSVRFAAIIDAPVSLKEIPSLFDELEPFDQRWCNTAEAVKNDIEDILSKMDEFLCHIGKRVCEYEQLSCYLVHRYYMKALREYYPEGVLYGIGVYLGIQLLFDLYTYTRQGKFDFYDRIDTAKYLSKQLEYSQENIDLIMSMR